MIGMGQRGFTLLELLIALAAMVLVSAVLGGVLRLGSRAWERAEQRVEAQQRVRDLVTLMSQELSSAYPYPVREGEKLVHFFRGDGGRVRFVSALSDPAPDGQATLRLVTFFVERGRGLFVQSTSVRGGGLPEERAENAHLLDARVREMRLRYLAPEGWVSSWEPKEITATEIQSRGLRGSPASRPAVADPPPSIPRAVEVILTLAQSREVLGPLTFPIFAATDLKKANPAGPMGRGGS